MNRLHEIAENLMYVLQDNVSRVQWTEKVIGLEIPKELQGSFTCTGLDFKRSTTTTTECTADYVIYIVEPQVSTSNPRYIETLALATREALTQNYSLNGYATDSAVTSIKFATGAGRSDIGAAIIDFKIFFEIEEE